MQMPARRLSSAPSADSSKESALKRQGVSETAPLTLVWPGEQEANYTERQSAARPSGLTLPSFRSLLVPLDGSVFAEHALPLALALARACGAQIRLVHVHSSADWMEDPLRFQTNIGPDFWRKYQRQVYLNSVLERLEKQGGARGVAVVVEGRKAEEAIAAEAHANADLVIMASQKRSRWRWYWPRSVAAALLRQLAVPLVLVRGSNTPPAWASTPRLQRVLVPLDGSEASERALPVALAMADAVRAESKLLRVIPHAVDKWLWCGHAIRSKSLAEKQHAEAKAYLRRLIDRWEGQHRGSAQGVALDDPNIARAILRFSEQQQCDLIALTVRQSKGIMRRFRRQTIRLLQTTSTPVMLVPAGDAP